MLTKKLKKIGKECRKADDPILLTLAAYVDHVGDYLGRGKDDGAAVRDYGDALAHLDLSAVVRAHQAFAAAESTSEQEAGAPLVECSGEERTKGAKKKESKKEKKAQEAQAAAAATTASEAGDAVEACAESSNNDDKKAKKNKRKEAKKKGK